MFATGSSLSPARPSDGAAGLGRGAGGTPPAGTARRSRRTVTTFVSWATAALSRAMPSCPTAGLKPYAGCTSSSCSSGRLCSPACAAQQANAQRRRLPHGHASPLRQGLRRHAGLSPARASAGHPRGGHRPSRAPAPSCMLLRPLQVHPSACALGAWAPCYSPLPASSTGVSQAGALGRNGLSQHGYG